MIRRRATTLLVPSLVPSLVPLLVALLVTLTVWLPASAAAQPRGGDGYLFGRPASALVLRGGAVRPNAAGGVFDFVSGLLMPRGSSNPKVGLGAGDYLGPLLGADLAFGLSPRAELVVGGSVQRRRLESEYRAWVGTDDQPIAQTTRFDRVPITIGLKWNLVPPGRSISRLVWVPNRLVPYLGVGGGAMWWRFRQEGEFVDFQSAGKDLFRSTLQDRGWTSAAYAAAGLAWAVRPSVALTGEVRYEAAEAPLRGDFVNFRSIGLSGVGMTTGVQLRF